MLRQTDNCVVLPHAQRLGGIRPLEVIVFPERLSGENLEAKRRDISRGADNRPPTSAQMCSDSSFGQMSNGGGSKENKDKPWLQIAFAIVGEVTGSTGTAVQLKLPDPSSVELEYQRHQLVMRVRK